MSVKTIIKLIVSTVLLAVALSVVDFHELLNTVRSIPVWVIGSVVVGYMIGQLFSALKWWFIVRSSGIKATLIEALRAYYVGMFFNVIGVGTLGGDVARAIVVSHGEAPKSVGVATVVADRMHGLAVLACIGLLAVFFFGKHTLEPKFILGLGVIASCVILGWFFGPKLALKILPENSKLKKSIEQPLQAFPTDTKTIITISILSAIFHFHQILLHALMAYGLGVRIPWLNLLVAVPFANIVSSLPISWQGLGVRENAYRFFLVPAIITNEQAVAFGAMWVFAVTVSGLVGGIIAFTSGDYDKIRATKKVACT